MTRSQLLSVWVIAYLVLALSIAIWAHRRTHRPSDYLVAGRRGGALLVGLSQALNLLPVWLMLMLSASAFVWGLSAIWGALGLWFAGLSQAIYVAPRARKLSASQHSVTLIQLLSCESGERLQKNIVRCASFLVGLTIIVAIIVQLQLVALLMAPTVLTAVVPLVLLGAFVICVATAGWWAHAMLEAVHALIMLIVVILTALLAHTVVGGWDEVTFTMRSMPPAFLQWDGGGKLVIASAFIGGSLALAGLALGQPSLLNRAIAARDEHVVRMSGVVLMLWLTLLLPVLLAIGWLARVLYFGMQDPQMALLEISRRTLHPAISLSLTVLVSGALLTNVITQMGVLSAMLVNDLRPRKLPLHPEWSRVWTVIITIFVLALLPYARTFTLADMMFCWTVLGATLAPLLIVRLAGKRVRAGSTIGAMSAGFVLVCIFHAMPDAPGDFLERVLPFVAGIGIALSGGERRRNPDRADRSEETVHDRLPI